MLRKRRVVNSEPHRAVRHANADSDVMVMYVGFPSNRPIGIGRGEHRPSSDRDEPAPAEAAATAPVLVSSASAQNSGLFFLTSRSYLRRGTKAGRHGILLPEQRRNGTRALFSRRVANDRSSHDGSDGNLHGEMALSRLGAQRGPKDRTRRARGSARATGVADAADVRLPARRSEARTRERPTIQICGNYTESSKRS